MIARWWWGPNTGGQIWAKDRSIRSFDGTEIRYTVLGPRDAPAVAFCAGFVCPDTFWRYVVPGLSDAFRVVVWNYRGVGVSGLPRSPGFHCRNLRPEDMAIEAYARDLRLILGAEHIERTTLVGHSMGVQTILECYRQFPERVNALVALAGAYRSPLRTFYGTDATARLMPFALPLLHTFPRATLLAWRAALRSPAPFPLGQRILRAVGPRTRSEDMRGFFEHLSMTDPLIVSKMIRGMHDHSAEDVLERIAVPALLVHGSADTFTPPRVARVMALRIPGADLVMLPGGGHTLPLEYPDEILDALRPFLEKVAGG